MKKRKWSKAYSKYRAAFYKEKRRGNIKKHQIVFSQKEFREAQKWGFTSSQMLKTQKIFTNKEEENQFWRQYKYIRKFYSRGETMNQNVEHFTSGGGAETVELGLRYHYNISGLLNDKYAMHFVIAFRIDSGEDEKSVLADYGY